MRSLVAVLAIGWCAGTVLADSDHLALTHVTVIAMTGGSFKVNTFTVAWPTGEFGTMGLEGAVRLGYRAEMDAIDDPDERRRYFDEQVAAEYRKGKAIRLANAFAVDDTIDPADSRFWEPRVG